MALVLDGKILLVALVTVAILTISISAQQTKTGHGEEVAQKILPKYADGLYFDNPDVSTIDNKFLKEFADLDRQYGRDWLFAAGSKSRQHEAVVNGLAETPLGNISQQCYDDVSKFTTDIQALQTYALKSKCLVKETNVLLK